MVAFADEFSAQSASPTPVSVWDQLRDVVDVVNYRPKLRDGLVWRQLTTAHGEEYVIAQNPETATYLRLPVEAFFIFTQMDGSRTVQDLVVAYMLKFRKFALQRVVRLVAELRSNEFLVDPPYFTFQQLRRRARRRTIGTFLDDYLSVVLNREFPISGIDGILERAYRSGIWILFTRPALLTLALISGIGVPLFIYYLLSRHFSLFAGESLGQDLVRYYVSFLIIAMTHELSHAFTVKSCGRVVRRGGLCMFYGFPGLFVDTQDIWMEPRRARIAASWAGPYSGVIFAGLVGLLLTFVPDGPWATPVRLFGSVALVANLFQLMPLIQLDGYFILMDWLEIPLLRKRALAFVRHDLWAKIRRRQAFNREERIFAIFGLLAAVYTVYAIALAASFWWSQASDAIQSALKVPDLGSLVALLLVALLIIPFALALFRRLLDLVRVTLLVAQRTSGAARERWLRQRAALLAQVSPLASLSKEQANVLAGKLREEHFSAGVAVVRQGDRSDRFYLVADGLADVILDGGEQSEVVATLGIGDYFGERALLYNTPRAATVRAQTSLRLFSLSAADFHASLAPYVGAEAALRQRLEERAELDQFPLFDPLGPREKDLLLARLRTATYAPGQAIIQEGEAQGDFYCLRSGHVSVTRQGQDGGEVQLNTLGPHAFFGEVALLLGQPRNATVRALDDVRVWTLSPDDFHDLLRHYFDLQSALVDVARGRLGTRAVFLDPSRPVTLDGGGDRAAALNFRLESVQGGVCALSDFRGMNVVLWLSRGLADPGCADFSARLDAAAALFQSAGVQVIQIVPDSVEPARAAWRARAPKYPLLCDPKKSVYMQYDLCVLPPVPSSVREPIASTNQVGPGSWLDELAIVAGSDAMMAQIGIVQEGVILIDRTGAFRAKRLTAASGPLPEPQDLLRRMTRAVK